MRLGRSIARYGDQEFMLMLGANGLSQECNQTLRRELQEIVANPPANCLIGVPTMDERNPFYESWNRWRGEFAMCLPKKRVGHYVSAFVTRPDQAPWLNNAEYFDAIESLWRGKDVTLVSNGKRSLTPEMLTAAESVRFVSCPYRDAYREIDRLEKACGSSDTVILCAGPTATCLAARLSRQGKHALDLGHIGRFWRRYEEIAHWGNEREIDKTTGQVKENPSG